MPLYTNPYAGAGPQSSVNVMVPWLPLQEGVGYPVANGATGGSQDVFVVTAQLDFTGQVITPTMDYLPVPSSPTDPNPRNPAVPFGVSIQAWETQDFLGEVFLCYDAQTAGARVPAGIPGDILSAHMYTSATTIIDWLSSHPEAQASCQLVVRYSPFNNFPDFITSLANGVRLGIDQGYGYGRVVDATLLRRRLRHRGYPVKGRTRIRAMKTRNQRKAFLGISALSPLRSDARRCIPRVRRGSPFA